MTHKEFLSQAKKSKFLAVDTETTGLTKADELFCISLACESGKEVISDAFAYNDLKLNIAAIKKLIEDSSKKKIFHNAKFDIYYLKKKKINVNIDEISDTMIIAHLLYPEKSKALKEMSKEFISDDADSLKQELEKEFERIGERNFKKVDKELLRRYAAKDAELTLRMYKVFLAHVGKLNEMIKSKIKDLNKLELETMKVLSKVESKGLLIDKIMSIKLKTEFTEKANEVKKLIMKIANKYEMKDINIDSNQQVLELLEKTGFDMSKLPDSKTGKSLRNDNIDDLEKYDKTGLVKNVSEYRHYTKMISIYIDNFLKGEPVDAETVNIHQTYLQTGTVTGRFSSIDPNLQNIPRGPIMRQLFVAPKGSKLLVFDYKQIEVRILAHCSEDYKLTTAFIDNKDIYTETASKVIYKISEDDVNENQRFVAKKVILGIMYGMGAKTLSKVANISIDEAKTFIGNFYNYYQQVKRYRYKIQDFVQKYGYAINIYGRIRNLDIESAYKGVNSIIQGSTADFMRYKMIAVDKLLSKNKLENDVELILQVHDELVYTAKTEKIKEIAKLISTELDRKSVV